VRRLGLVLLMMGVALVVGSEVAIAAVKFGTDGRDELIGTNSADRLFGKGASDFLAGKKRDDVFHGGSGNDFIMAVEAPFAYPDLQERDVVFCGPGTDAVYYMEGVDRLFDCERKNPR
jgi:hypothetical protein